MDMIATSDLARTWRGGDGGGEQREQGALFAATGGRNKRPTAVPREPGTLPKE